MLRIDSPGRTIKFGGWVGDSTLIGRGRPEDPPWEAREPPGGFGKLSEGSGRPWEAPGWEALGGLDMGYLGQIPSYPACSGPGRAQIGVLEGSNQGSGPL